MGELEVQKDDSITGFVLEGGAKKTGENAANRALNAIIDGVKNAYGSAQVQLGTVFRRYLENATIRYNQVRTLATGQTPRNLIGDDNIYVKIDVEYGEREIDTETVNPLLKISNNILIQGTGGIGKSMLMRYLFLNTANRGEYVPVLLQLRRVSSQKLDNISIINLIYNSMKDFDIELPKEQFEYSLRLGKYLFLMDGFDEIKEDYAKKTAEAIQEFCSKYPKNACIITSRPRRDISPLETFTEVKSKTLDLNQAVLLSSKIWKEDEKTKEFCRQLREGLYEKHKDFAENPLLLSMMFLTFMKNNSVPEHLAEFYSKAFDAIYCAHDSHDKGYFLREFKCEDLDENSFRFVLYHFCFYTYFKEIYEFTKKEVIILLTRSIDKLEVKNIKADDYLKDLCDVICMLVEEGDVYRFSHRSFQTYFAACYTSNVLTDMQQKKVFASELSESRTYWSKRDYYELLAQIEPRRFEENALENDIRYIYKKTNKSDNPDNEFIKLLYHAVRLPKEHKGIGVYVGAKNGNCRYYNVIEIFFRYISKEKKFSCADEKDIIRVREILVEKGGYKLNTAIDFTSIEKTDKLTNEEKQFVWKVLCENENISRKRRILDNWIKMLDEKRRILSTVNFIDEL